MEEELILYFHERYGDISLSSYLGEKYFKKLTNEEIFEHYENLLDLDIKIVKKSFNVFYTLKDKYKNSKCHLLFIDYDNYKSYGILDKYENIRIYVDFRFPKAFKYLVKRRPIELSETIDTKLFLSYLGIDSNFFDIVIDKIKLSIKNHEEEDMIKNWKSWCDIILFGENINPMTIDKIRDNASSKGYECDYCKNLEMNFRDKFRRGLNNKNIELRKETLELDSSFLTINNADKYPRLINAFIDKLTHKDYGFDKLFKNYSINKIDILDYCISINEEVLTGEELDSSGLFITGDEFIEKYREAFHSIDVFTKKYINEKLIFNKEEFIDIRKSELDRTLYQPIKESIRIIKTLNKLNIY